MKVAEKKYFLIAVLFLLIGNNCFAQYSPTPSQFDKFIIQPSIEWAAYVLDTVRFSKINLNKLLFERYKTNNIKVSLPLLNGASETNHISYVTGDSLDDLVLYPMHRFGSMYDSNGNLISPVPPIKPYKIDTSGSNITNVTQVFYIENGQLKSYVTWVSPCIVEIRTGMDSLLGLSEYFSSCHNLKFDYAPGEEDQVIFLVQSKNRFRLDSILQRDKLKQLYGRGLVETLWPYITDNKLELYSDISKTKINPWYTEDTISTVINLLRGSGIDGNLMMEKYGAFPEIQIVQDWYYNYTDNIVFNKVREIYIYIGKWAGTEKYNSSFPILKIVFK